MFEIIRITTLTFPILIPGIVLIFILKLHLFTFLDFPLDMGFKFKGKRVFGDSKTIKGVLVMIAVGVVVCVLLQYLYGNGRSSYINPLFKNNPVKIALIYVASYVLGELINSFIKRRLGVMPGKMVRSRKALQNFFDLSDGIILTVISLMIIKVDIIEAVAAGCLGIGIHYLTDISMIKLKLKNKS